MAGLLLAPKLCSGSQWLQLGLERFVARMKRKNPDAVPSTLEMLTMNTVAKLKVRAGQSATPQGL